MGSFNCFFSYFYFSPLRDFWFNEGNAAGNLYQDQSVAQLERLIFKKLQSLCKINITVSYMMSWFVVIQLEYSQQRDFNDTQIAELCQKTRKPMQFKLHFLKCEALYCDETNMDKKCVPQRKSCWKETCAPLLVKYLKLYNLA